MNESSLSSSPSPSPSPGPTSLLGASPLRHEAFRAIWIAAICSYIGNWLQDVGESWAMMSLTTDAFLVAMVTTSFTVPCFALMLPAGVLSDRFDRRRILLIAQSGLVVVAGALCVLTASKMLTPAVILICSALLAIGSALSTPAWQTLVPDLVSRREMPEAVTLNSVAFNIARAVGPALGGMIIAAAGPAAAFGLNALSFLAVIHVLRTYPDVKRASEAKVRRHKESFVGAMARAMAYAKRSPGLRAIYAAAGCFGLAAASIPALLPVFAKRTVHANETGYGILLGAIGLGAILGAFALKRVRALVPARTVVAASMGLYGVCVSAMTMAPSVAIAAPLLVPAGLAWICAFSTLNALVQLTAPSSLRSRLLALYQLAFYVSWSAGASIGGAVATQVGVPMAMRLAAFACVAGGVLVAFFRVPSFDDVPAQAIETPAPVSVR